MMFLDNQNIHSDQIVKIESTNRIVKRTSFFEKDFCFIGKTDLLLNLMQEYEDITIDQATTDPILNSLLVRSDNQTIRSKVAFLLAKYAEALMVIYCNENDSFNRHFARKARFGRKSPNDFLDNFTAISTGSAKTKENYQMHYQYSESQRDIVWVDKRDVIQLLTIPKKHGATAGLQIKVSYDWKNLKSKITQYYYPILYFSMSNDWHELNDYINLKKDQDPNYEKVTLLPMDDYSNYLLNTLFFFQTHLINLIEGRCNIEYLIQKSIEERATAVGHALSKLPNVENECLIAAKTIQEAREINRREQISSNLRRIALDILDRG